MSRRNKLGAVSFEHWPNSEGEALSTVVLAAHLEAGIRGHVWAMTRRVGTGLGIDAVSAAQTRWDSCTLTPVISAPWSSSLVTNSMDTPGKSKPDRFVGLSKSKGGKSLQTPPRAWCVLMLAHYRPPVAGRERDSIRYLNAAKRGKNWNTYK